LRRRNTRLEVPFTKGHERFTDRKWRQALIDTRK
jgi:hypothetical protein